MNVPVLETPRLTMRGFQAADFEAWAALTADDETMRAIGRPAGLRDWEAWDDLSRLAGHWALRGFGHWALEERDTGELVGRSGLLYPADWPDLEVGWVVRSDRRGRGYAGEAATAAMRFAHDELGADHVISLIAPENQASRRVAEKLGERPQGTITLRGFELTIYRRDLPL